MTAFSQNQYFLLMPRKEHILALSAPVAKALHEFAGRVFSHRTRHHLSRRALAEQVGCSESNIKNIETEESAPSFAVYVTLEKIIKRGMEKL